MTHKERRRTMRYVNRNLPFFIIAMTVITTITPRNADFEYERIITMKLEIRSNTTKIDGEEEMRREEKNSPAISPR